VPRLRPDWLDEGDDPDYRFSLANERTFLAWIRTALAFIAGSVAIVQLVPSFRIEGARLALGITLAVLGLVAAVLSYVRWSGNERAMRCSAALPFTRGLIIITAAVFGFGSAVLVLVLFGSR
jgi:putative membrane protein